MINSDYEQPLSTKISDLLFADVRQKVILSTLPQVYDILPEGVVEVIEEGWYFRTRRENVPNAGIWVRVTKPYIGEGTNHPHLKGLEFAKLR